MPLIFNNFIRHIQSDMEKENESKIKELEKCIKNQSKDIKRLKKKQGRKMIRIKFVGVIFDPNKFKNGQTEVNDALSDGFEVIRDFETAGGIVMALGKWEKKDDEEVKKEWNAQKMYLQIQGKSLQQKHPSIFFQDF